MSKKYPKSDAIENVIMSDSEAYVTWGEDLQSKQEALKLSSGCLEEYGLFHANAGFRNRSNDYSNLLPGNISGKPGLTRRGYDYFRPDEAVPTEIKLIIRRADDVYQRVGLVKNVKDLMADFAVQGRDLMTGIPKQIKVSYTEIAHCLDKSISKIEEAILKALEITPPELSADIYQTGIYLTGGGALLRGLDKRISAKTKLPVHIAEDPLRAVVRGTGIALKNIGNFKFLMT